MAEKLSSIRVANTLGIVFAGISLLCAILVLIFPEATMSLFSNIFHGIDLNQIARASVTFGNVIIGLIVSFVLGWIIGWFFARVYNKMKGLPKSPKHF